MGMEITLNNRKETLGAERLTVTGLLEIKNFTFKMLLVKVNGRLVPKDQYATVEIREGDDVMVLHLISGG